MKEIPLTSQEKITAILEDMEMYTIGRLKRHNVALTVEELQTYIDKIRENLTNEHALENERQYGDR